MENNYLITGYWGEPHVTAENDRGINAAIFGAGRFVLPVGRQFKAEYIGSNTIRIYDGKLIDNGAVAGIPAGEYIDLLIANTGQGLKRNDLIVFQYSQDASTLIERGSFVVVQGAETSGAPSDPELTQADLLSNEAVFDQMAMWRVSVSGGTIAAPERVFDLFNSANKSRPVGSLYFSEDPTSPAELFGGTWTRIKDVFPLAAGDIYDVGDSGGEATHTLKLSEMPTHTHNMRYSYDASSKQWLDGYLYMPTKADDSYSTNTEGSNNTNVIIQSAGGGEAHNNMPPYLAVYVWKRIA